MLSFRILALASIALAASSAARADDTAVRDIETAQEAAWNAHDAHAYAQLFAADAQIIDVSGAWWKSRDEAERKLGAAFAGGLGHSKLHVDDVAIRSLSPDLAIAFVSWTMSEVGAVRHGVETQVLKSADGRWLILSSQNTGSTPERALPAPVAAAPAPASDKPARKCMLGDAHGNCLIWR